MSSSLESFRLVVFRTVAEKLSFTQAAEVLRLTQPAVTSHIKALEDDLSVRLFERTSGRIAITPAGAVLARYAAEVARLSEDALLQISALNGEQRGKLRLGASTTIAQYVLPQLLVRFLQIHPRVEVSVTSLNTQEVVAGLLEHRTVLGLIEGPPGTSDLKTEDFLEDEIVVIAAAGHPWVKRRQKPGIADLASQPLVMREPGSGTRRVAEDALRRTGLAARDLQVALELDSTEGIKSAVEAGLGVGLVSRWALRNKGPEGVKVVPVEGLHIVRMLQFVYPHGPDPEGVAGAFLRLAREFRDQHRRASRAAKSATGQPLSATSGNTVNTH
jgi:DNA-binding transcriptional LysR family regulator